MNDLTNESYKFIKPPIKKKTRWTGVGRKRRSEAMRALALKKHAKLTSDEKHYIGVKMAAYRWQGKKTKVVDMPTIEQDNTTG